MPSWALGISGFARLRGRAATWVVRMFLRVRMSPQVRCAAPRWARRAMCRRATIAPRLSCDLGTPERKIVDEVGEAISAAYIDQYLIGSLLDIENKTGLKQFVGIFGFARLQGKAATGSVRITVTPPSSIDQSQPAGTQFDTTLAMPGAANPL